jgi:hypothetical protein
MLESCSASWAEIAQLELFVMQKDILYFDISMSYRWVLIVHMQDSSANITQNVDDLLLTESFATKFDKQIE